MPSLTVNPASNPSLMDVRAHSAKKKNGCPRRAQPLRFLFLRPVQFLAGGWSQAGNEAGPNRKGNNIMALTAKKNEAGEPKKGPAEKIRVGSTTASIWENTKDEK